MKILQVNNYHYLKGGSERVYLGTSKLLEDKGHSVIHFSVRDPLAKDSPTMEYFVDPVNYEGRNQSLYRRIRSALRFIYSREAADKLEGLLEKEKPDIAHLHIFYGRLSSSILPVLKKYNVPMVMTVHEYRMMCPISMMLNRKGDACEKCAGGAYFNCVLYRCNRGSFVYSTVSAMESYFRDYQYPYEHYIDRFIFVSKYLMEKHLQYKPTLKEKMALIYHFINYEEIVPLFRPGDYYLYFGRLSREKGLMTFLKVCRRLPGFQFKIVGDGPLKVQIVNYIERNKLHNVALEGHLTGDELSQVISQSKYIVAPSEGYETFGLNIIEGFAHGKPVIASSVGAIPEIVQDHVNGFLFPATDEESLATVIQKADQLTTEEYAVLSQRARQSVETRFGRKRYYEELMAVYDEVMAEH